MTTLRRQIKAKSFNQDLSADLSKDAPDTENSDVIPETLSCDVRQKVVNRLARVLGHLQSIKRMVEDGREIESILVQVSAVRSAVNGVCKELLNELASVRFKNNSHNLSPSDVDKILVLVARYMK